ncbi:MAG: HAD family hydrolase [Tuberibacillus sp.]
MYTNIKVMVFDLDGTLYSDTQHFDYYAERLKEKLPRDFRDSFMNDYRMAREGKHVIKIGRVYDVLQDLVLIHKDRVVIEALEWNGYKITEERMKYLYPEPIKIDNKRMLSIGDLWWVPVPIARHYGLDAESGHQAFIETREYMMGPDFTMKKTPGLVETFKELHKDKKLVLLTNSPEPDSRAIIEKLGLNGLFHKYIFSGKKPTHTVERFETIRRDFGVSFNEMLSIGDNWVNEIHPVQQLGVKTLFINQYDLAGDFQADYVVTHIEEALGILKKI